MRLRRVLTALLVGAACWAAPARAQGPVTRANWRRHPAIVAIRAIYTDIETRIAAGSLTEVRDSAACDDGAVGLEVHLFADSAGRVRKYVVAGGSGDSYSTRSYYYDPGGRPRFTLVELGAANGTDREDRFYFDTTGALLYRAATLKHGPGWPSGADSLVPSPRDDIAHLCDPADE